MPALTAALPVEPIEPTIKRVDAFVRPCAVAQCFAGILLRADVVSWKLCTRQRLIRRSRPPIDLLVLRSVLISLLLYALQFNMTAQASLLCNPVGRSSTVPAPFQGSPAALQHARCQRTRRSAITTASADAGRQSGVCICQHVLDVRCPSAQL